MIAFNFCTMKEYGGRNAQLKGNGKYNAFAGFQQIKDAGFHVTGGKGCGIRIMSSVYEDEKTGKKSIKWATVFDIKDTDALKNKGWAQWFDEEVKAGRIQPSGQQINHELVAAMSGGAKGVARVQDAYSSVRKAGLNIPKKSTKTPAKVAA